MSLESPEERSSVPRNVCCMAISAGRAKDSLLGGAGESGAELAGAGAARTSRARVQMHKSRRSLIVNVIETKTNATTARTNETKPIKLMFNLTISDRFFCVYDL